MIESQINEFSGNITYDQRKSTSSRSKKYICHSWNKKKLYKKKKIKIYFVYNKFTEIMNFPKNKFYKNSKHFLSSLGRIHTHFIEINKKLILSSLYSLKKNICI